MKLKTLRTLLIFLILSSWFFSGWPPIWQNPRFPPKIQEARAATTGAKYPTLGETISEAPWSDNTWSTPTNIYSDNGATANVTASSYDNGDQTYVLKATGFDFSAIPDGSTIDGVIVRANSWYRSGQGSGSMDLCQLLNTSKAKVGTNNCSTPVALTTTNTTIITKGSSTDLWGNALTTAWVKSANFGVAIGILATAANADVDVDYVTVEIYYTPPPNNPPSLTVSQPDGTGDTVIVGQSYNITYDLSDAEDVATVDFYYDANGSGLDGTAITGCQDQAEGTGATCSWNTTGMTAGSYYVYGIATDGINPNVNDYSPGMITIQAAVVSVSVSDGVVSYGMMVKNTSKTTLSGELNDMQTATNNGNVTENFNIKGQNTACSWTLASSVGNNQYVHQFCNDTDNDCSSPPTNYTALTTSYQTLDTGTAVSGTVDFQLRLTTPTDSSCFNQQSVNVVIQAVQQ